MKLFVTIYNDASLLSHFLRHYKIAGITEFYIAVAPEFALSIEPFVGLYNITACVGLDVAESLVAGTAFHGTSAISEMRRLYQQPDEWVVIADLDEFVEFPYHPLVIASAAEKMAANVVRGIMVDRFSLDGQPREFTADADLSAIFPVKSRFTRNVMGGCDYKGVLVRGHLRPAAWHHRFVNELTFGELLEVSHYKWIPGVFDRMATAYQLLIEAGAGWAVEYDRVLAHYTCNGRFAWETFGGAIGNDFRLDPPKHCVVCGGAIGDDEVQYSISQFGSQLCRTHQTTSQNGLPLRVLPDEAPYSA